MNTISENTNNTMNQNVENHILDILKLKDFNNFIKDISKRFEVSVETLLPKDYTFCEKDSVFSIEQILVNVVMYNLFKSLEKRNFTTEYIAYTKYSVDTAKVYFMGVEVYDLSDLVQAETFLGRYEEDGVSHKDEIRKEFSDFVSVNTCKNKRNIAIKFGRLYNAIENEGIDEKFLDGSLVYYIDVEKLINLPKNSRFNFVKTFFNVDDIIVDSKDTYHFSYGEVDMIKESRTFDEIFQKIDGMIRHKEQRVYVFSINNTQGELGNINELSDEEFMDLAERDGRIFSSVECFINAFNYNEVNTECDYARIIEIDCFY